MSLEKDGLDCMLKLVSKDPEGQRASDGFNSFTATLWAHLGTGNLSRNYYPGVSDDIAKRLPASILSVGAGSCVLEFHLSRKLPDASIVAVEPSMRMRDIASRNIAGRKNIAVVCGDSEHVPNTQYEMIVSSRSVQYWNDITGSLEYLKQRLASRGEIRIYQLPYFSAGDGTPSRLTEVPAILIGSMLRLKHAVPRNELIIHAGNAGLARKQACKTRDFELISLVRK